MTIKKMVIVFVLCILVATISLIYFSQNKYTFYTNLIQQTDVNINKCNQESPSYITKGTDNNNLIKDLTEKNTYSKVYIIEDGYTREIRYYYDGNLIAVDLQGYDSKIVRREIFDINGDKRISLYFYDERPMKRQYFDEKGDTILSEVIYIPESYGGTIY
jgi:hypothetical protein